MSADDPENGHVPPERLAALAQEHARIDRDAAAFVERVLTAKPALRVTQRAIEFLMRHANADVARLDKEHRDEVERVRAEHQSVLDQLAVDDAAAQGIDLALYQLHAPGDVPAYWKPR